jgi:hypothetical protein
METVTIPRKEHELLKEASAFNAVQNNRDSIES